ncbi:MAG: hypothetical protein U0804_06685 [Gemmataceae bacterium]
MTPKKVRFLGSLICLTFAVPAVQAQTADPPSVGTAQVLPVLTVSMAVSSTGRDSKWPVYAPPPGWYVRSHYVCVSKRSGYVTYTVSTVPTGWQWMSDEQAAAMGRASGSLGVVVPSVLQAGGQAAGARDAAALDRHSNRSSHHVLLVEVTARGAWYVLRGSSIEMTVYADMVYLGQ